MIDFSKYTDDNNLGYRAIVGEQQAIDQLTELKLPIPISEKDISSYNEKAIWIYRKEVRSISLLPALFFVPKVNIFFSIPGTFDAGILLLLEHYRISEFGKISEDKMPFNGLSLNMYGTSWLAFTENTFPFPDSKNQIISIHLLSSTPKFHSDQVARNAVAFNQGVGVQVDHLDFPLQIGHTYWLVPTREEFSQYQADFFLEPTPQNEIELFYEFPIKPQPFPFTLTGIHLEEWGTKLYFEGNQQWLCCQKDIKRLIAEIPASYPHIYLKKDDAEKYAGSLPCWD